MYRVYYTLYGSNVEFRDFDSNELTEALTFTNEMRNNEDASFVTMVSDNVPGNVGKAGVAVAGPEYDWKKRRNNERDPNVAISRRKLYNANDEIEVPVDEE